MIRVTLEGGKFDGVQLSVAAPYTPKVLWLVPSPTAGLDALVVGTERMVPGPLFSDAAEYRLDTEASDLRDHPLYDGMDVGRALYRPA